MKYIPSFISLIFLINCSSDIKKSTEFDKEIIEVVDISDGEITKLNTNETIDSNSDCNCTSNLNPSDTTLIFSSPTSSAVLEATIKNIFSSNTEIQRINIQVGDKIFHFISESNIDPSKFYSNMVVYREIINDQELCYSAMLGWLIVNSGISKNKNKTFESLESISHLSVKVEKNIVNVADIANFEKEFCRALSEMLKSNLNINICNNEKEYKHILGIVNFVYYFE
jgi:hypothetical protein